MKALLCAVCIGTNLYAQAPLKWAAIDAQADSILQSLTLRQKVGQTCQITVEGILNYKPDGSLPIPLQFNTVELDSALNYYGVGSILNVPGRALDLENWHALMKAVQGPYRTQKAKLPILYGIDAIHGANYVLGATLFPQEIGLAATFNPDLAQSFAEVTAAETRMSGVPWNFSPVLDLGRQPCWSRFFETLGEDPFLASSMGAAVVRGYQGDLTHSKLSNNRILACMKHFVGYSSTQSGRDRTPGIISARDLTELYLPPFKAAVQAGALTVMINSASVNGMPGHINSYFISDILKGEWNFKGFAVTDWEDILFLQRVHQVANSHKEAIALAFNAGIDMSMVPLNPQYKEYCRLLVELVQEGTVPMQRLNDAVKRILRVKIAAGLFEPAASKTQKTGPALQNALAVLTAQQAVDESLTLLKNQNATLPLRPEAKVLVFGQAANDRRFWNGAWTHTWQGRDPAFFGPEPSLMLDWQNMAGRSKGRVSFLPGVSWTDSPQGSLCSSYSISANQAEIEAAEVCVVFVSEWPGTEKPGDDENPSVCSEQIQLIHDLKVSGKRVVVVLMLGRPKLLHSIVEDADAIVHAYLPGEHFSEPFLKKLYGQSDFSGRLPFTYPRYAGRWEHYDHAYSEKIAKDNSMSGYNPQWDFATGLTYAEWTWEAPTVSMDTLHATDTLWLEIRGRHNGKSPTKYSLPVFASRTNLPLAQRGKFLIAFDKKEVPPNQFTSFRFPIAADQLKFADYQGRWTQSQGPIRFEVLGKTTSLFLKP